MDLKRADPEFVRERFSVVMQRMVLELRGIPCLALEEVVPNRKNIMASRSFGRPVETRQEMEEAVSSYAARAAEKMRRQKLATAELMVFVETNSFRPQDRQYHASKLVQLPVGTADTSKLITAALRGLNALWKPGYRYKKAGVMLLDLGPAAQVQAGLFDAPDDTRSHARMRVVDTLNGRFGRDTIVFASTGKQRAWKLRRERLSPRYTTNWDELLRV